MHSLRAKKWGALLSEIQFEDKKGKEFAQKSAKDSLHISKIGFIPLIALLVIFIMTYNPDNFSWGIFTALFVIALMGLIVAMWNYHHYLLLNKSNGIVIKNGYLTVIYYRCWLILKEKDINIDDIKSIKQIGNGTILFTEKNNDLTYVLSRYITDYQSFYELIFPIENLEHPTDEALPRVQ